MGEAFVLNVYRKPSVKAEPLIWGWSWSYLISPLTAANYTLKGALQHDFRYFSEVQPTFFVAPTLEIYRSMLYLYLQNQN